MSVKKIIRKLESLLERITRITMLNFTLLSRALVDLATEFVTSFESFQKGYKVGLKQCFFTICLVPSL